MKIIMLGVPGAGKGTQVRKIVVRYQVPHIFTGDIFQVSVKNGTELGIKAKSYMDVGGLVPDEITIGVLLGRIHEEDHKNGYVLDRFSRTIPQAESLIKALGDMGEVIDYAVNMDVPDENIVDHTSGCRARLPCGVTYHIIYNPPGKEGICNICGQQLVFRDDDKPETVRKCLDVYHGQVQSLIRHYKEAGVLAEIDGTLDMGRVFQAIVGILGA